MIDFAFNGIERTPRLGDLDGDEDKDLIVGDELGLLHAYITAEPQLAGVDPGSISG